MSTRSTRRQAQEARPAAIAPEAVETAADALLSFQFQDDDDDLPPTRMSHKQVEQHRRMKAKQYFEELRAMIPSGVDSRSDRNKVLSVTIDYLKELLGRSSGSYARSSGSCSGADDDNELMFEMDDAVKLSHNVVEQRRRHMARGYFDELRSLLPHAQAAKFDKNTVLLHTVALIRQLQAGLSTASSDTETETQPAKGAGESRRSKPLSSSLDSSFLSKSPNDVVSFTASNFSTTRSRSFASGDFRRSRKRLTGEVKEESPEEDETAEREADDDEEEQLQTNKRSRVVPKCAGCGQCEHCDNTWEERAAFDALSLLSECAYQLSQPNTPQLQPSAGLSKSLPTTFTL